MNKVEELSYIKKVLVFLGIFNIGYVLVAIGDVVFKGYSDLPSYPMIIGAVMWGALFGTYLKKRKEIKK